MRLGTGWLGCHQRAVIAGGAQAGGSAAEAHGTKNCRLIKFLEQGVTNKRVILKKGIISRKTEEMKLKSIETFEINQGILGRIFGFATIKITGRGISDLMFKGIDDPMSVKKIESINPAA
jgi:hypothetical protein